MMVLTGAITVTVVRETISDLVFLSPADVKLIDQPIDKLLRRQLKCYECS
jgi:K+-sensing histidine kinase KdpD